MPIYLNFASPSMRTNFGKGRVYGMKQGLKTLTPGNLRSVITQIGAPALDASSRASGSFSISGSRRLDPITILKEGDPASPVLLGALYNNTVLDKVVLNFYKPNPQGKNELHFTITLTNATIVGYRTYHGPSSGSGTGRKQYTTNELEEIKLTFQKIVYTWTKGGISFSDDWDAPV